MSPTGDAGFDQVASAPMGDAAVAQHLRDVVGGPGFSGGPEADDLRISIAGAQEKTALLRLDLRHAVQNEWLCAQLLQELGFPVARTEMARFEVQDALVVERFERAGAGRATNGQRWITRLPQEDLCQVFGLPSGAKYESSGGPSMQRCTQALLGSQAARDDVSRFLCAQLALWLLAATDGHAKNFSVFLLPAGATAWRRCMT